MNSLEKKILPKLRLLESTLQPINRLPKHIFVLIPHFFTKSKRDYDTFPMNKPLITMTHVCRSWRNVLLSTPSLWTQVDFATRMSKQAKGFLGRSGNQLLDIHQILEADDHVEPFLSTTLRNIHRVRRLDIDSFLPHLERMLVRFTEPAPKLEHLKITNDPNITDRDMKLDNIIFGGRLPKLTSLSLHHLRTNLRGFDFPSLTRFVFTTGTDISVLDLASFFERCPLLELIQISLSYPPQPPVAPPRKRIRLAALKALRFDQTASTSGLLDHLVLPKCTEVILKGQFTDEILNQYGSPAARIHPSSIGHISAMRGITKATAMPNSCILSGPNGNLRFWCFKGVRGELDAGFFASFSPISVSEVRELWVGQPGGSYSQASQGPWKQTTAGVRGVFEVLTKVEDLTFVSCETEPFFAILGAAVDDGLLLPGLRRLTIYVGYVDLNASALMQCAKARKEHSPSLKEVTVVFEREPGAGVIQEVESIGEFVGELTHRIGETPKLTWLGEDCDLW